MNTSKAEKVFRTDTIVVDFEPVETSTHQSVQATQKIQSDLLPHNDQTSGHGTRTQRLSELIKRPILAERTTGAHPPT